VTEPIGLVEVKGKGKIETWRLVGPRAVRPGPEPPVSATPSVR
jgi:hypothetical protein